MDVFEQEIRLVFRYPVHFTTGVFSATSTLLRDLVGERTLEVPARVLFVLDRGVAGAHPGIVHDIESYCLRHKATLRLAAPVLVIAGGERAKNDPRTLDDVLRAIHDAGLCRHSYVVAVGGGAVLDVVGYAAATAHRGIRLIRVPTTILAQDDSAVGVKNGINAFGKKNYLGTFATPFAVINDFAFLHTLSDRDWRGGLSEAVKAALIKDRTFFDFIEANAAALAARDLHATGETIRRSAALHLAHIGTGGDPFELGSSRPLDFGHWSAHKLEQLSGHRLSHGEAVGIGLALDTTYSWLAGFLPEREWKRVIDVLLALRLPLYAPELGRSLDATKDPRCVLQGLEEFREHLGGRLTIMLLRSIGEPFDVHELRRDVMVRSIETLAGIDDARADAAGQRAS
jgi:3-dehydroquinate synthase